MNQEQLVSVSLIGLAMILFVWGRFRYDLVSLIVLLVAVLIGDVKPEHAFEGFTSDVVIIIASALVVSAAISRSGVIEPLVRPLAARFTRPTTQVPILAGATALFAMVTKNVGALATLMPVAIRLGRGKDSSPSALLMPMSFLSLLGGLVTLVGTSTNIIVSEVRQQTLGAPFKMFDFAPVGLALTGIGLIVVSFGWRLIPRDRHPRVDMSEITSETLYSSEARVPDALPDGVATIADLNLSNRGVRLVSLIGPGGNPRTPLPDARLEPGLRLVLEGQEAALGGFFADSPLEHVREANVVEQEDAAEPLVGVEVVVEPHSRAAGRSAGRLYLQDRYGIKLLAIARAGERIRDQLAEVELRAGDLLLIQASEQSLARALQELGLLPLAERAVTIGDARKRYLPAIILVGAIVLIALQMLTVAIGFFAAAVLMVATRSLTMREAYASLEPEVLVLIGALTPLSHAVQPNGGTAVIGQALAAMLDGFAPMLILGGIMLAAMVTAPFLHNAPTVLVLAPIGVTLAHRLGLSADAFLMAVATGAGSDFLTPIGHQCNTLVRGPGGYRFGDYWRLGLPLSVMVIVCGTPLIAWVWGL
ncbi:MAG: SLC13 family permease [Tsuneonella sp.]